MHEFRTGIIGYHINLMPFLVLIMENCNRCFSWLSRYRVKIPSEMRISKLDYRLPLNLIFRNFNNSVFHVANCTSERKDKETA